MLTNRTTKVLFIGLIAAVTIAGASFAVRSGQATPAKNSHIRSEEIRSSHLDPSDSINVIDGRLQKGFGQSIYVQPVPVSGSGSSHANREQVRGSQVGPGYSLYIAPFETGEQVRGSELGPGYPLYIASFGASEQIRGSQLGPSYTLYIQSPQPAN